MSSLPHFSIVRPTGFWVLGPLSWKAGIGSKWSSIIQDYTVSELLHHLDTQRSMGTEGAGGSPHWASSHHLSAVLVHYGAPVDQRLANTTHPQEGQEGESRELQACQPDPGTAARLGRGHLECHHATHAAYTGDQAQPDEFMKGKSFLANIISLYDRLTNSVYEAEAANIVCLDIC